MANNFI